MALSQRLSTMEEYEPWSREASPDSRHRKLSFNPVGTWVPPIAAEEPVGAFEISKTKRIGESPVVNSHSSRMLTDRSPGNSRRHLLPLRRWDRIRVRSHQASPHKRRSI